MKNVVIFGAGGMGREVAWLIENINSIEKEWNILGFIDDDPKYQTRDLNGYSFLGGKRWLENAKEDIYLVLAIGKSSVRKSLYERFEQFPYIRFATLIDPLVRIHSTIKIDDGCVICRNCTITVNINIGKGVLMNTGSSVGHDSNIGDFCTFLTNSISSGETQIGECCEIGSGAFILQGKKIVANTKIAPLASVLRDIEEPGIYSGNPARRII
jgi:sugar O-acyltransferase (sialic acid O-acetyltransferase NeuD family)